MTINRITLCILIASIVLCWPTGACGFTLNNDPWYYQSNKTIEFWVPDKAQHFYGSYFLCSRIDEIPVFILGFGYEYYQKSNGDIFSSRDLIFNVLGIVASKINSKSDNLLLWCNFDTDRKEILIRMSFTF